MVLGFLAKKMFGDSGGLIMARLNAEATAYTNIYMHVADKPGAIVGAHKVEVANKENAIVGAHKVEVANKENAIKVADKPGVVTFLNNVYADIRGSFDVNEAIYVVLFAFLCSQATTEGLSLSVLDLCFVFVCGFLFLRIAEKRIIAKLKEVMEQTDKDLEIVRKAQTQKFEDAMKKHNKDLDDVTKKWDKDLDDVRRGRCGNVWVLTIRVFQSYALYLDVVLVIDQATHRIIFNTSSVKGQPDNEQYYRLKESEVWFDRRTGESHFKTPTINTVNLFHGCVHCQPFDDMSHKLVVTVTAGVTNDEPVKGEAWTVKNPLPLAHTPHSRDCKRQ